MRILDGFRNQIALAMAGKKGSPWGSGGGSGDDSGSGGDSGKDRGKSSGPRNPWLPGGGEGKRSANIEDIFKNRGPEGPRRRGGGSGGGFKMPPRPGGKSWFPVIAIGFVALWVFMTGFHQVEPEEEGIVTTFGKYSRTIGPGISITLPSPIQQVYIDDVTTVQSIRIPEEGTEKLILTGDQNLVDLQYKIRYRIKDLKQFRFQLAEPEQTVIEVAEAAMRASVAEQTLDATFSGAGRAQIQDRVRVRMQGILDAYRAGVSVLGIDIEETDPPAEVVEAFKDVSVAEQDANAAINRARGVEQQILARAEGDTAAFDKVYEQYRQAPEVTRRRLYYETMERVLSQTDKTIVESGGVQTYLPLPEIRKRAQQSATSTEGQ
ncbi:protease modulator HflK [Altererythrobacter aquiaggeris]|uniref:protease modulator HflK n=1 Tax=Aestuarierythrobacter aquiaggeris TaxID=1898396 RepID=UPI003016AEC8